MITMMVAMDRRGAIGRAGTLPWSLPEDLREFKRYTQGKAVVMGYKTAVSIGRTLPERTNLVLSRQHKEPPFPGQVLMPSVGEVLMYHAMECYERELVIIGGAQVYRAFFPYASKLRITDVDTVIDDADTFFIPSSCISAMGEWQSDEALSSPADEKHAFPFTFRTYTRVPPC